MKRAATAIKEKLWPNATIPYAFGINVTDAVRNNILLAIGHWQSQTCIRFVERTVEEDYIVFESGPCGCCSYVGRKGSGPQDVTLSAHCASYGVVVHELGHVVGFWHEHSRPDRDRYINILRDNINQDKLDNFDKKSALEIDTLGEIYDYESIMHYRKKTFSKNGQDTLLPTEEVKIGQRRGLSIGDIAQTRLLYNCPKPRCYEEFTATEHSFLSPNYPQNYHRDFECEWIVVALPGEVVTLEFIDFALERSFNCTYDYIEMREGKNQSGKLIGRMCGEGVPGTFHVSSSLWIKFVSDSSDTSRGFWAHYLKSAGTLEGGSGEADDSGDASDDHGEEIQQSPTTYTANCNQDFRMASENVSSPLVPILYGGQPIECSWLIDGGPDAQGIMIKIKTPRENIEQDHCLGDVYQAASALELKQRYYPTVLLETLTSRWRGRVKLQEQTQDAGDIVLDVEDLERFRVVKYNCRQVSPIMLTSNKVMIQWSSQNNLPIAFEYTIGYDKCRVRPAICEHRCDNMWTGHVCSCHLGYYLHPNLQNCLPKMLQISDQCGSNLTSERGILIASRNSKADDCVWHVSPPGDDLKTHLVFVKFYVPSAGGARSCAENYLEIRVGKNLTWKARYCDRRAPPVLSLPSGNVFIRLRVKHRKPGIRPYFTAKYFTFKNSNNEGCGLVKLRGHGEVTSPGYPKSYPENALCKWRLSARRGDGLKIQFMDVDIEPTTGCHFDYLEIRSGHQISSNLIARYCGTVQPPDVIAGHHVLLVFVSDGTGSGRGFRIKFTSERNNQTLPNKPTR